MKNNKKIDCTKLKPVDRITCEVLLDARRPLTTNEVAEYGNISWLTAKKHLEKLSESKISESDMKICRRKQGRTDLWYVGECKE